MAGQLHCSKLGKIHFRHRQARGFRLNSGRLFIPRLHVTFCAFFGSFSRCLRILKEGLKAASSRRRDSDHEDKLQFKVRTCTGTNSFYSEAIADCLEFIKRKSLSEEENIYS